MSGGYVVFLHPYDQHRVNRIAKRDGVTPMQVERQFTGKTGRFMGLDLILSDRVTASSEGA